ncbi:hypothetical protein LTR56_027683 [Elasticomyces elasticus]|nr:hypothetical protein LTR56_027683 [Elasticomyces elasticus]KAK3616082.1 hypothetical protein LTR22_027192 [Elasticomyces elasticus]KAK4904900.1 hypothetical protein LTR49_025716 [Elasticomyces elasticus]KAK5749105.1 hypothetical protein LTS12_020867 [Elasticomyces elasticus]
MAPQPLLPDPPDRDDADQTPTIRHPMRRIKSDTHTTGADAIQQVNIPGPEQVTHNRNSNSSVAVVNNGNVAHTKTDRHLAVTPTSQLQICMPGNPRIRASRRPALNIQQGIPKFTLPSEPLYHSFPPAVTRIRTSASGVSSPRAISGLRIMNQPRRSRLQVAGRPRVITPSQASSTSRFEFLPAEIRNAIYELVLIHDGAITVTTRPHTSRVWMYPPRRNEHLLALTATSRSIRKDALSLFYGMNVFMFTCSRSLQAEILRSTIVGAMGFKQDVATLKDWLQGISACRRDRIMDLTIDLPAWFSQRNGPPGDLWEHSMRLYIETCMWSESDEGVIKTLHIKALKQATDAGDLS